MTAQDRALLVDPATLGLVKHSKMEDYSRLFLQYEESDAIRMTWNIWPHSKLEATRCVIPFAALYTPNKRLVNMPVSSAGQQEPDRGQVPGAPYLRSQAMSAEPRSQVLQYEPVPCKQCSAILNPYATVDYTSKVQRADSPARQESAQSSTWQDRTHSYSQSCSIPHSSEHLCSTVQQGNERLTAQVLARNAGRPRLTRSALPRVLLQVWVCPFCMGRNHFPPHYQGISETQLPPELYPQYTTIEYRRAPQHVHPPVFLFLIDTCVSEDELNACKTAILQVHRASRQTARTDHTLDTQECPLVLNSP